MFNSLDSRFEVSISSTVGSCTHTVSIFWPSTVMGLSKVFIRGFNASASLKRAVSACIARRARHYPGKYATENESNVTDLAGREAGCDELAELLRNGVRTLIAQALQAAVTEWLERFKNQRDEGGRAQLPEPVAA